MAAAKHLSSNSSTFRLVVFPLFSLANVWTIKTHLARSTAELVSKVSTKATSAKSWNMLFSHCSMLFHAFPIFPDFWPSRTWKILSVHPGGIFEGLGSKWWIKIDQTGCEIQGPWLRSLPRHKICRHTHAHPTVSHANMGTALAHLGVQHNLAKVDRSDRSLWNCWNMSTPGGSMVKLCSNHEASSLCLMALASSACSKSRQQNTRVAPETHILVFDVSIRLKTSKAVVVATNPRQEGSRQQQPAWRSSESDYIATLMPHLQCRNGARVVCCKLADCHGQAALSALHCIQTLRFHGHVPFQCDSQSLQ